MIDSPSHGPANAGSAIGASWAVPAAMFLAAAFFAIDLSLPLGVAAGVPYIAVILLGLWLERPGTVIWLAALCTILTALGYLLSLEGGAPRMVLLNRIMALFAIWVTAVLVVRAKSTEARVRAAKDEAETLAELRTKELRMSESRIRAIADNVPVLISYVDTDGRYQFNNATYNDWFGLSPTDLVGRRVRDVLGETAYALCEPYGLRVLAGESVSYDADLPYAYGAPRSVHSSHVPDFDENGGIKGYFSIVNDVTELKRAEVRLRDAIEALSEGFAIYDKDDRLVLCNERYRDYVFHHLDSVPFGATFEEILRDKLDHGHYPDAKGRQDDWLAERLRVHQGSLGPVEQKHSNGRWYRISERRTEEGGVVVVSIEITEQKRLEAEILRQERLATLGQLTATVSHELRNPLGVIRTSAFIVSEGRTDTDPFVQRALERIERSVVRCDRIIDELLDFTRISEFEPEPTALDSWLDSTLSEQDLPQDVALRRDFNMAGIDITIDRDRLRRVVINVFDNACQAMTDPASKSAGEANHILTVTTRASGGRVEIVFEDNGPGVPADVRPMIFEPLFSTKGFGVGLGLAVVKQIMENHGGGIDIDSNPGQGARACLWLPVPASGSKAHKHD